MKTSIYMYYKLIHFMCVLDGPCIETTEKLNIDQKNPKLQTNLICIFEKKRTDNRRYTGISRMHRKIKGKKIFRKCGILWQKNKSSSAVRRIRFVHFHLGQDASGIWHIYNQSLRSRLKKYYIDVLNDYSSHLDSFMKIVQTKRFVSKR